MAPRFKQELIGWLIILMLGITYTWAIWRFFTLRVPGGNDFMAHYTAWEAYLKYGYSPYSDEAALYTQEAIYGRPALPSEDQNRLTYPFYSILVHGPFIFIDYALARAIYMTLLQAALFIGVLMCMDQFHWRPPTWMAGITLAWCLLYYPEARGVILGQFAIFGFLSLAGALYFLKRGKDIWAGALLVLSTVKPTLVFLAIPFLLLWGISRRRWLFIGIFLGIFGVLVLVSFLVLPTWMSEWILRMTRYDEYTVGQSPVWLLTHVAVPYLGQAGEITIAISLLCGTLFTWWLALRNIGTAWFYWALSITLMVSNLIVPRSATTNYVMLLIPTIWIFAALDRSVKWGRSIVLLGMTVSVIGLWWLHLITVVGNQEQPIMFIPYPLILSILLLLGCCWLRRDAEQNSLKL